jgi:CHAD domain-containing protein
MHTQHASNRHRAGTAESCFSSFAAPLVDAAISHAAALKADSDAEVLHKLRVSLRRLRSLLWAYRPLLDADLDDKQRDTFKRLAAAAGKTRDWDILIELLEAAPQETRPPTKRLRAARSAALHESRESLSHTHIRSTLNDALESATDDLSSTHKATPLKKFARHRLRTAQKSLHKRMRRASRSKRSDYASYHGVRKAGKKVRYLLDFFESTLPGKQLNSMKGLKKLQKKFGALNDVVASEELLRANTSMFRNKKTVKSAMSELKKRRKQRTRAAAKLLP